ncbi:MAG: bifunctional diaminohydroxyphosphoribosylaminopyrimidine deaminase/5-amino-6-(5-phosphoribosylamino)uracil reductase RibD [Lachnospiraceae bacterium]
MTDLEYMKIALELAQRGCGWVAPNPMVGAVIVKKGNIIGKGWHRKYGELHAEREALADCTESPKGATLYVTLEPCCHHGKTPPCTTAIIESGIQRVVIATLDPNPLVGGKGRDILSLHGIQVTLGVLEQDCRRVNEIFFHYIQSYRPYVVMKYAMTADGKIATCTGESKWITGTAARENVQQERHRCSAIMVGVGTVLSDDPMLTCRLEQGKQPIRIICDTNLRTPLESRLVKTAAQYRTILATAVTDQNRQEQYRYAGCEIIELSQKGAHIDLELLMQRLGRMQIDSILLEGGGTLNWSALESKIVNKVQCYIAPKLFGGRTAVTPVMGQGVNIPEEAFRLIHTRVIKVGEDILIEGEVEA